MKEVILALIASAGTVLAAYLSGYADKLFNRKKKEFKRPGDLLITFQQLTELNHSVVHLFNNTSADRFLLLISKGGNKGYVWVSAIYEQHFKLPEDSVLLSIGATGSYVKLDLDSHYKSMIDEIRSTGKKKLCTNTMGDCMLKNIYIYEKVTFSNVYFLYDIIYYDEKGKEYTSTLFCSIAKHGQNEYSKNEETHFKMFVDKIKNEIIPNR